MGPWGGMTRAAGNGQGNRHGKAWQRQGKGMAKAQAIQANKAKPTRPAGDAGWPLCGVVLILSWRQGRVGAADQMAGFGPNLAQATPLIPLT